MICPACKHPMEDTNPLCPGCGFNLNTCVWVVIACVYPPQDIILESLLKSYDLPFKLIRESMGPLQGLSTGPLAEVRIAVPEILASEALEIINPAD